MKRILFTLCLLVVFFSVQSQNFSNWTGSGNWSNNANWSSGTGYGQLQFTGGGNTTNCVNDVSGMSQWRLYFSGGASYNLTGSGSVNLFDYGGSNSWILSDATVSQTINFAVNFNDNGARSSWITTRNSGPLTFVGNLGTGGNITGLRIAGTNTAGTISINTFSGSKPIIIGRDNLDANQANTRVTITGNNSGYTGTATVQAGTLFVNGTTSSSTSVTVANGATIAGNGTIGGTVSLSGIVSPGGTSATTANLTMGATTFNANSSYRIEMNDATGTAGSASGWDRITSTGAVTCSASPITLTLVSLSVANFNPANSYTWPIVSASSISGFNSSNFTINTTGFTTFTGTFAVTLTGGNTINLVYSPPSSAPAQPSAISGASLVCNGTSQTYSVTNDPNATSYLWTLPSGWTGTSTTNSITTTVAAPGGSISVVAQNASGDSLPSSLIVTVGDATSITSQPSASSQSACLGGSVTPLSVTAVGGSLIYQWYSNTAASNSGGTLISGATSSSYTPTYAGGITQYYYCVVEGSCAPTSVTSDVSGGVTIGGLPFDTGTYTISNGGNAGQGFGPWGFAVSGGSGGTFNGGSDIGQAWGIWANSGGLTSAVRPFVAPLSIGSNVSFAFDNGEIEVNGNKVGVRLRNSSNNILSEFRFIGGDTQYSLFDGTSTTNTGVNFTTTGLSKVTFAYTGANTYTLSITRGSVTTVLEGRTFATAVGGQVPAQIEFFNSNAGGGSTRDVFFNALSIGYPTVISHPSTSAQNQCLNAAATALNVTASGNDLGYQWYSNPGAILLSGQTASSFTPPTNVVGSNTYYCVVSYAGSCGTAPSITSGSSGTITVNGNPTATISGTATVCQNAPAFITLTGADGTAPYQIQYSFYQVGSIVPPSLETLSTNSASSITVPVVTSATGTFVYDLVNVQSNGCTASASGSVTITVNASSTFYTDADMDTYGDLANPVISCTGSAPEGTVADATDCDDADASKHTTFPFYLDADADGFGFGSLVEACASDEFSPPLGYSLDNTDCDDTDSRKTITYPFYADADGDSFGAGSLVQVCAINDVAPPTGYSLDNTDCDDADALKHTTFSFYIDTDGDTYGSTATAFVCAVDALSPPVGYSVNDTDCDDTDALKTVLYPYYVDADNDSYGGLSTVQWCTVDAVSPPSGYSVSNTDCDDNDPLKFNLYLFYEDQDADGYGAGSPTSVCGQNSVTPPSGYSLDGTDCDDSDDSIYRNDTLYVDLDGDGYDNGTLPPSCYGALPFGSSLTTLGSDCDDSDDTIYRSADLYVDVDGDGHTLAGVTPTCYGAELPMGTSLTSLGIDCDDNNPAIYQPVNLYVDEDGDTYTAGISPISCIGATIPAGTTLLNNPTDCDDNNPATHAAFYFHPDLDGDDYGSGAATLVCAIDQNTPPTGYANDNSDCDDNDSAIYRSATLYTDVDADGYNVGSAVICYGANLPAGTSLTTSGTDCDDNNALVYQSAVLYTDVDQDTYTVGSGTEVCYGNTLPAGTALSASLTEDCDDANPAIFQSNLLYTDVDADGYDVGSVVVCYGATLPAGKSLTSVGSDCDDLNPAVHQSTELYADADNDGFGAVTAMTVCAPVSCASNTIAINFRVNMTGQTITAGGVHIAGNFATRGSTTITSDWAPNAANSQLQPIGNNIYEITVLFPASSAGQTLEFKFLRGNTWFDGNQLSEQNIPNDCGASGNRNVVLPATFLAFNTAYDQCPTSLQKFVCNNTDCNDADATKNSTFEFYADVDNDGFGTGSLVAVCAVNATTPPTGYSNNDTDCDDSDSVYYRSASVYTDADNDTYTVGSSFTICYGVSLPLGVSLTPSATEDCDDANATIYQSATVYTDADADTYTFGAAQTICYGTSLPNGFSLTPSLTEDCDDADAQVYRTDVLYTDVDGDGYDAGSATVCYGNSLPVGTSLSSSGPDCDDNNANAYQTFDFYLDADGDTYGAGSLVMVCTSNPNLAPVGYSTNNTDCDDTNSAIYQFATFYIDADGDTYGSTATASVCSGVNTPAGYSTNDLDCDDTNPALNPTNPCSAGSVVNLTLFIEGYYIGGSTMNSVKLNQDYVSPADEVEDLTIELHDATSYALVDTAIGTLKTDGTLTCTFNTAAAGSYYIVVKGSNIIETWSATAQAVGTTPLSYDFSSGASQAYGDNMREIETGVFAMYTGDLNLDQVIDNADLDSIFPDIENSNFGVLATDLNGDGVVDNADLDNIFINIENSIFANYPF
ncbi:hypothetical protein G4D82_00015 [Flavobacterium sp. CYK-4]|uniref:hypothetical protein n=1 Tax=Flavobacterium lotistagni TaxID=2709660 RepID=UPI00140D730F|nr:hypothetical protein [Flavobacterium lotistagni]NHM05596.1 hypothetical protein [Flavobacterium lotistagni]